ncbi:hypothetical protein SAMN05444008_10211 [Cnuella takakiae]|uniref:Outer membrane protein beta-barrel domain-containing protein n=1 Tax=Cnuella takakiae TaxID=1302690 RepID=A0A1M4UP72_9BACT|nr:hypothetical protein [Cnuella takakiae]OLY92814.1 hypothetical protein BUE76_13645 [Cnuella takakiae]SHE58457.1 hypothetical protein SAMN05444008_10211 [Cnuella takakiae]
MKQLFFGLLFLLFSGVLHAQQGRNALGIRFSNNDALVNTGISFRHYVKSSTAIEGTLSFDPAAVGILVEKFKPLGSPGLNWFYGGGGYVAFSGRNVLGAQGIIGLDYTFSAAPINVSLDWKPELELLNDVSFEPAAVGLGIRFTF